MARFTALLLGISLLMLFSVGLTAESTYVPLAPQDFARSQANLEVSSVSPEWTTISLSAPNVVIENRTIGIERFQAFTIEGEPLKFAEGEPSVPQVSRFYRIPNTGSVETVIRDAEFEVVENINALPLQVEGGDQMARNQAVYSQNAWYPASIVEVSEPAIMRDFRVISVTLHPVQVNPVTRQARIYRNITVDLVANDTPGANELLNPRRPSGQWAAVYRSMIANLDETALDDATTTPGSYMIICHSDNQARRWADSLFEWKTRKGFKVVVDARTNWYNNAGAIITAIRTAYATWDPPLEFVCLIGDPQWSTYGLPVSGSGDYDHEYALGNTGDEIEDIGVGRLSGNSSELAVINAKIMGYERNPYMADTMWYHRAYLLAGVAHEIASNYALMQWGAQSFRNFTGVDSCFVNWVSGHVNDQEVINQFNRGISFFLWRGSWLNEMEPALASSTNPGWRLPVCLTITCGAGNYDTGLGTSESYLVAGSVASPRGGICAIGSATASTHAPQNITVTGGVIYNICNLGMEHIGPVLASAKYWLSLAFGFGSSDANSFSRYNNLMGDPGLSIWTDVPKIMNVAHPTGLNVGARQVAVQVRRQADNTPIKDALVVLWKRGIDSTYVKGLTDAEGRITLPVNVNAIGEMTLTVTKRNHKPYLVSLPCTTVEQMPMFCRYSLDDDNVGGSVGNGDGIMNPGETIDLPVYVKNFGTLQTATNVSAKISSSNPRVTVVEDSSHYVNLAPGDSALGSVSYRIYIAPTMQNRETALITMIVTTSAGQATGAFQLTCYAGAADYISHQFTDGAFNPGTSRNLRVTIQNKSTVSMNSVTGQLVSLSPFVQVDDNTASFGNIAPNASVSNGNDLFRLSSNSLTFRGHQAPMLLLLTTASGTTDTTQFVLYVGSALTSDPTGPDAYGYYAYDNTDTTYEMHPDFNYVNISSGLGQNLNINDTGEQNSITPVWSVVRRLPFAFKFYGQVYDSITICSNGWAAFGNQSWFPTFRNYQIPGIIAPDAMIAAYWDDLKTSTSGKGVWHYFDETNHRYIIQWKAENVGTPASSLDFEIILMDTAYYPTFDGNGQVIVQYQTAAMNLPGISREVTGSTIGIQAAGCVVGLQYANQSAYAPGAATVTGGRAILFTTDARMLFGAVEGTVRDSGSGQPMSGAEVTVDGFNYHATTDNNGWYHIDNVLIGTYTLRTSKYRFNPAIVRDVLVELDSTVIVNFSVTHPEIALSTDAIYAEIDSSLRDTVFHIINSGNGPLDYTIDVYFSGDENPTPWDSVASFTITSATGDAQVWGCEFVGDYWWVTGGGGPNGQNMIYRFNLQGELVDQIPQPSATPQGWFDMAFDGQYVYGSDNNLILGIDEFGVVHDTIPSPMNPTRAIAYDPETDHFWVTDYTQDIFEIERDGDIVTQVPNDGDESELAITGLAWNPVDSNGYKLYIFSQNRNNATDPYTRISRYSPEANRSEFVIDLPGQPEDRAGGCTITGGWNSTLLVFAGIFQSPTGDHLNIYEMSFNTTWISVAPDSFFVPGQGSRDIQIRFNPQTLRPDTYRVDLRISSEILDTTIVLPVALTRLRTVSGTPNQPVNAAPQQYALRQNYPNPFNPATMIRYDLPQAGLTKLTVFDLLGKQIAVLVNEKQPAGSYQVSFNAANLPSGMYFYRLESGSFVHTAKMVLMK